MGKTILPKSKQYSWQMFNKVAPTYDRLNKILSFGIDKRWRKNFSTYLPSKHNLTCLDLATGTGDVAISLAKNARVKTVVGLDLSEKMIIIGQEKIARENLSKKVRLENGDGVKIPKKSASFDVVTVAFGVRNFADYKKSLKNLRRVLKPGGLLMILEFSVPKNPVIRFYYLFYLRHIMPKIGKLVSKDSDAYSYLNRTIEEFPYGEKFVKEMTKAGFKNTHAKSLSFGISTFYTGQKM